MTEGALAQVPANGPAHARNSSFAPPFAQTAAEDAIRKGIVDPSPDDDPLMMMFITIFAGD